MIKVQLRQIAEIQTGFPFRGAIVPTENGQGTAVFQLSNLGDSLYADETNVTKTNLGGIRGTHFLKKDDIIFRSRGNSSVGYWLKNIDGPAVVAAPLQRVRITDERFHPGYVVWCMRQPAAQSYFEVNSQGTSLRMVGLETLEAFEIAVIPPEMQIRIVALIELAEEEKRLTAAIQQLKEKYLSHILDHKIGAFEG